jgi:hypothetical protein
METRLHITRRPRDNGYFVELTKGADRMEIVRTDSHYDALMAANGIAAWSGLRVYDYTN